ncbi:MAG TPA: NAD(P)-dependent alcohol dehydrogenase [Candidatus Cybelea sp.]|nr:NAD(P)-dependent alcohol dehydrogenase [Candidatus Cybelea sp.]
MPQTMQVMELSGGFGLANLKPATRDVPAPGAGQVLVRMRAASLNYRDTLVVQGGYGSRQRKSLVPLSDGAGEVAALGSGVTRFKVGARVVASFFQGWISGEPTQEKFASSLGGGLDGVLAEYCVFDAEGLVPTPGYLSDEEAACVPCAGLTAWSAVVTQGDVRPGQVVLVQGTGGVSLFALQFAKLCGAEVIATSSSDEKLARSKALGADHLINYKTTPEWGKAARAITKGRGVDHVVEVGGAGTLKESIRAVKIGGTISMIGVLAGPANDLPVPLIVMQNLRLQGVTVGSREGLEAMLTAMTRHGTKPVVDRVFPMKEAHAAFEHMTAARHIGKIVVRI